LPFNPILDWNEIQPVKMINLLLQNNINLSVLCRIDTSVENIGLLIVENTENQIISLQTGLKGDN
jgi:hypothetical protein